MRVSKHLKPSTSALGDIDRVRLIVEVMRECNEKPTLEAVNAQFKHETGRDLPEAWARTPPSWLLSRIDREGEAPVPSRVDEKD